MYREKISTKHPKILCACGCGEMIYSVNHHKTPPKYKKGHNLNIPKKGVEHPNWKGGIKIEKGYELVLMPDHPDCNNQGYVRKHRLVMEEHIGRRLLPHEDVHHINEIKDDNRIENLQLVTRSEHTRIHMMGNQYTVGRFVDMSNRICKFCGSSKTWIRKDTGYANWYRLGDEFLCKNCYKKKIYHQTKSQK